MTEGYTIKSEVDFGATPIRLTIENFSNADDGFIIPSKFIDIAPECRRLIEEADKPLSMNFALVRFLSSSYDNFPLEFKLNGKDIYCKDSIKIPDGQHSKHVVEILTEFNFYEIDKFHVLVVKDSTLIVELFPFVDRYVRIKTAPTFMKSNHPQDGYFHLYKK